MTSKGGPGRGQGNKRLPEGSRKISKTFRLKPGVVELLKSISKENSQSQAAIIEQAVMAQHGEIK
ncbi:MAG: hypothetical protein ACJAYB_000033 [Psychromonas sp.]|jgi:hypothetical protein